MKETDRPQGSPWLEACHSQPYTILGPTEASAPEAKEQQISSAIFCLTQGIVLPPPSSLPLPRFISLPFLILLPFLCLPLPQSRDPDQLIDHLKYSPLNLSFVFHSFMLQKISQKRQISFLLKKKKKSSSIKTPSLLFPLQRSSAFRALS